MAESEWLVACLDPFGRHRGMTVLVQGEHVVMISPPGQSAVLSAEQTRQLGQALDRAGTSTEPDP